MKKDIFEILKHNGHKLEVVKEHGIYKIGCVECGETLYIGDGDFNIYDVMSAHEIAIEKGYNTIASDLLRFAKTVVSYTDEEIEEIAKTCISQAIKKFKDGQIFFRINAKDELRFVNLCSNHILPDDLLQELGIDANIEYIKLINKIAALITINHPELSFMNYKDQKVVSNRIYEVYNKNSIVIYSKDTIENLESEFSTDNEIVTLHSAKEFFDIQPDSEDEYERNQKYEIFMSKLSRGLIKFDMNKEEKIKILASSIDYFNEYEEIQRETQTMVAILKEFGIDIKINNYFIESV